MAKKINSRMRKNNFDNKISYFLYSKKEFEPVRMVMSNRDLGRVFDMQEQEAAKYNETYVVKATPGDEQIICASNSNGMFFNIGDTAIWNTGNSTVEVVITSLWRAEGKTVAVIWNGKGFINIEQLTPKDDEID